MRLDRFLRDRGWNRRPDGSLRHRLYRATSERPWWDWGRRLMDLTGRPFCGSYDEPKPPTWWYRQGQPKRMWRTGFPRHPLSTYEVITDWETFHKRTAGLNEDQMYEWQAINVNEDGELQLGHRYWGGNFYGLSRADTALLRRYLRAWRRRDWYGLRSWLYAQGLHATVYRRKPFACNARPSKGHGGYDHWACQLKRRHDGMHRFGAYTWGEIEGEPIGAYSPQEATR